MNLRNKKKKKFAIEPGSTIVWNGDPLDADVNINAIYTIRTSAIDLVADQISDAEKKQLPRAINFSCISENARCYTSTGTLVRNSITSGR